MWGVLKVREILVALNNQWLILQLLILVTKVRRRRRRRPRSRRGSPSASPTSPGRCPALRTRQSRSPSPWTEWSSGELPERGTRREGTVLTTWPEYSIQDSDRRWRNSHRSLFVMIVKILFLRFIIIFVISSYCWCLPALDSRFCVLRRRSHYDQVHFKYWEESNGFISVSKSMFCNKMKNFRNILKA